MNNGNLPASPTKEIIDLTDDTIDSNYLSQSNRKFSTGLTKREHFAAMAMQGLCSQGGYASFKYLAADAVTAANALLAALEGESVLRRLNKRIAGLEEQLNVATKLLDERKDEIERMNKRLETIQNLAGECNNEANDMDSALCSIWLEVDEALKASKGSQS